MYKKVRNQASGSNARGSLSDVGEMLRYQPPKSNVWGHALRGMKPSKLHALASRFEDRVAASVAKRSAMAFLSPVDYQAVPPVSAMREVEEAVGRPFEHGQLILSEEELDRALAFLVRSEDRLLDLTYDFSIWRSVEIDAWKIGELHSKTRSEIKWVYGTSPRVCTSLWFQSRDEFYHVQVAFQELGICRLSEKHLKIAKRGIPRL